jgi:hypothetical protein
MDSGHLNLFIKMIQEDYKLSNEELQIIISLLLADEREFDRVWKFYKAKGRSNPAGKDPFRPVLQELLN